MNNFNITAHMLVKNEDQWVWFAIQSILPYVDHFFITDTGSTDQTLNIISSISSPKIKLNQVYAKSPKDITMLRQAQLASTSTDWVWIIDGDEIYTESLANECLKAIKSNTYEGIVVRRYDLLGDIYHRQIESVGTYNIFGKSGHLLTRMINKNKIKGLHYRGDYPLEGFYDYNQHSTRDRDSSKWYITSNYLYHAMYLRRSSQGINLPMFNRSKFKIETGIPIYTTPPKAFFMKRPSLVVNPLTKRSFIYNVLAKIMTPLKQLKRKVL